MAATGRAGQLVDLSEASRNVLNLVKPQTTTSRADAGDNANADTLIQSLLNSSQNDHQALIDSILQRSAIEFAPTRAAEIGSGGYNSSVGVQLQNEARARATSEATGAVLTKQTEDQRIAATLEAAKLQANRTQTVQPPTSIGGIVKSVGTAVVANKLFQAGLEKTGLMPGKTATGNPVLGKTGQYDYSTTSEGASAYDNGTGVFSPSSEVAASGVSSGQPAIAGTSFGDSGIMSSAELDSVLSGAGDAALGNSASFATMTDSSVPNSLTAASPTAYGDFADTLASHAAPATTQAGTTLSGETAIAGGNGVVGGGAGYGSTGSAAPGGASSLATGAETSDVLSGASSSSTAAGADAGAEGVGAGGATGLGAVSIIPAYVGGTVATKVGGDLLADTFGGNNAGIVGDIGNFFGDAGSSIGSAIEDTVICTELHRRGKMDSTTRKYNALWAYRNINHTALDGYRNGWGPMYVRLMRRSPLATKFASIVMSSWSARIRGKRTEFLGMVLVPLMWIPSWLIGKYLQKTRSTRVWI